MAQTQTLSWNENENNLQRSCSLYIATPLTWLHIDTIDRLLYLIVIEVGLIKQLNVKSIDIFIDLQNAFDMVSHTY